MKLDKTALASLKRVAGVFPVHRIIPNQTLVLRDGRNGPQLVQRDGEKLSVVAVADDKPSLLSFAATNGFPVKNYTDILSSTQDIPPEKQSASLPIEIEV